MVMTRTGRVTTQSTKEILRAGVDVGPAWRPPRSRAFSCLLKLNALDERDGLCGLEGSCARCLGNFLTAMQAEKPEQQIQIVATDDDLGPADFDHETFRRIIRFD